MLQRTAADAIRDNLHANVQATGMAIKPRRFGREDVGVCFRLCFRGFGLVRA